MERQQEKPGSSKDTFFYIPHTHWEGAVFKTREEYLEMGLPHILLALRLLKKCPNYRFTLDQACYVEPFLDRYPEEEATFRRLVEEGRLVIAGGLDVMPDVNIPGGESFVRQVLYGKGYFRRRLGLEVTTGWQLDTFGHHAQIPQLMKLAGYTSFWFFRGVSDWNVPSEFQWEGIDGSQIPAFWLSKGYGVGYGSPHSLTEFSQFFKERFDLLAPFARGPGRAGPAGTDVCEPEDHVPPLVDEYNRDPDRPFDLRIAVPADYEKAVETRAGERQVITGELNPIFQGTYSSRIELKQKTRELEGLLTTAEKLGVILKWLGIETSSGDLLRTWEPMLFNHTHDLMAGVMTDHVYEDTIRGFDFSKRVAEENVRDGMQRFISNIDTQGDGIPLVVFNTVSWPRTDLAVASVGFSEAGVAGLQLVGPGGETVPVQIIESRRNEDGGLLRAKIAFVAGDVPGLGYSVYRLLPLASGDAALEAAGTPTLEDTGIVAPHQDQSAVLGHEHCGSDLGAVLENEHYRIEVDFATGAITSLLLKDGNWNALRAPGNVVAREEDNGDLWELYRPLDGGSRIAMKERHPAPGPGQAVFSTDDASRQDDADKPGALRRGRVVSEFSVTRPFGEAGRFTTTIRLCAGLRRIEVRTRILNNEKFVRYRLLFPTSIDGGDSVHEIPFGAIGRPEGIEFPAQNWIDYGNGEKGVALLNRGLPGNNVADGTMLLSLMRSTMIVAYGFQGGYEEGSSSASGFELGKELTFDYALAPHSGDWRQAAPFRDGMEFNNPFIVRTATNHAGPLPSSCWGFLSVSHPNVVASTMKSCERGGAVLRIYEAAGLPADGVRITLPDGVAIAEEVNLMEDPGEALAVIDGAVKLDLRPFEIKTIRFELQG